MEGYLEKVGTIRLKTKQKMAAGTGKRPVHHQSFGEMHGIDPERPVLSIGTAANMLEVHPRTLRIYEKEGLVKPLRKGQRRYYSLNDLQWISCLRSMIHAQGISIAGIKKLLQYTSCWNIVNCSIEKRKGCTAYRCSPIGSKD